MYFRALCRRFLFLIYYLALFVKKKKVSIAGKIDTGYFFGLEHVLVEGDSTTVISICLTEEART